MRATFGFAIAVFIDATIVRSVLVPSVMTFVGDRNRYLPRWLEWLPDVRIGGELPEQGSQHPAPSAAD
jgi:putative drug exporter of the RND superfamily